MKNDITYEYRVFTNRLIDIESMEVGKCTSKVIKELKQKEKVDGRFFHTSDTDEWFFCWDGKLQKLNLKGDSDVTAALEEAQKAISAANDAAESAQNAVVDAQTAAKEANDAAASIVNKADKSEVEQVSAEVKTKADQSVVVELSQTIDELSGALENYVKKDDIKEPIVYTAGDNVNIENGIISVVVPTKVSELVNDKNYLTEHQDISGKQDKIDNLQDIIDGASKGATALQEIPLEYVKEDKLNDYAKKSELDDYVKTSDIPNDIVVKGDLDIYATTEYVDGKIEGLEISGGVDLSGIEEQIASKQDKLTAGDNIEIVGDRISAINTTYTSSDFDIKDLSDADGLKQTWSDKVDKSYVDDEIKKLNIPSTENLATKDELKNYYTIEQIDSMIGGVTEYITNTILA